MLNIFKKKEGKKIFIKDRSSMYVWCNDDFAKSVKIKSDAVSGKSDYNFYSKKEAEKKIADEKKVMEKGKVFETDKKIETNKGENWIKEILIPLWDGSSDASGILGITWDYTSEKICDLEKEKMQKEVGNIVSTLTPVFYNLSQGKYEEKINVPEGSNLTDLYNSANSSLDSIKQSQAELKNKISQKNEELETKSQELNNIQGELEQKNGLINQKDQELESSKQDLSNVQTQLEKEKEISSQKENELNQEKQRTEDLQNKLEENKRKHREFVTSLLQDIEEKIKNINVGD